MKYCLCILDVIPDFADDSHYIWVAGLPPVYAIYKSNNNWGFYIFEKEFFLKSDRGLFTILNGNPQRYTSYL